MSLVTVANYENVIEHVRDGGDISSFISADNSHLALSFIVKVESFRMLLMYLDVKSRKNCSKLPLYTCIAIIGNAIGKPQLWKGVKHLVELRNALTHDVTSIILNLNDASVLQKATDELDELLEDCWRQARLMRQEEVTVQDKPKLLTCKIFC